MYVSESKVALDVPGALSALRNVLAVSQKNNRAEDITGFLIFDGNCFIQILEGPRDRIWATFERIKKDPRHKGVTLVQSREVMTRSFPEWSMGGALRTPDRQGIFLRHGIGTRMEAHRLTAPTILALAMDLQDFERAERARRLAG
jgi:hypothetical protein